MKIKNITYEEVEKLYNELKLSSQPINDYNYINFQITNRNFGIKDNTVSSNKTQTIDSFVYKETSKC